MAPIIVNTAVKLNREGTRIRIVSTNGSFDHEVDSNFGPPDACVQLALNLRCDLVVNFHLDELE